MPRGISLRVDCDEQGLHLVAQLPKPVERQANILQIGRANIRAVGESEIDEKQLAAEILLGARDAF
jgi:hypothetical protein